MDRKLNISLLTLIGSLGLFIINVNAATFNAKQYEVVELSFSGPNQSASSTPARDIDFYVEFKHETGKTLKINGYWDGDGKGGMSGNVFKIRFNPILPGEWLLNKVESNQASLKGQKLGDKITCTASSHPGFWEVDKANAGNRWFKRSNGSHSYLVGNTMYSFLSEWKKTGPNGSSISRDINENAKYYKKLRFALNGDLFPNPTSKPYLDNNGKPTDVGTFSARPNPEWFFKRVDLAVKTANNLDMICDLILNGVGDVNSRKALKHPDWTHWLKYVAARYGAYPNVWICLANEFDTKEPTYTTGEIKNFGIAMDSYLVFSTPLSVHRDQGNWNSQVESSPAWHSHRILQGKMKTLSTAGATITKNFNNSPVVNDELAYQGVGDGWSEADVIEAMLGVYIAGGYGTTGFKDVVKNDQYCWGNFQLTKHTSSDNLKFLSQSINEFEFWTTAPTSVSALFTGTSSGFYAMEKSGQLIMMGTNKSGALKAKLSSGSWIVTQYDIIAGTKKVLSNAAIGTFDFTLPNSRAVLTVFKNANASNVLSITTTILPQIIINVPWSQTLTASGGKSPYIWSVTGLPAGLRLEGDHIIGTPTALGTSSLTIKVTDADNKTSERVLELVVTPESAPLEISTIKEDLGQAVVGQPYSDDLESAGGLGPYTWTGQNLPPGMTVSSALLKGTPTTAGVYQITITVTDSKNVKATKTLEFSVVGGSSSGTLTFGPEADCYTLSAYPSTNYGTATKIEVGGAPDVRNAHIRFNIAGLPAGAVISSASIKLYCENASTTSGGSIRKFAPSTESWSQTQPTAASPLAGADATGDLSSLGPVSIGTSYTFGNLKSAITGNGRVTFVLRSAATDGAGYGSKENGTVTRRPLLSVSYTVPLPKSTGIKAMYMGLRNAKVLPKYNLVGRSGFLNF